MSVTTAELAIIGKSSIDLYLKNKPIDAVNAERPLLAALMAKKKTTSGAKQYLVAQIRKTNDGNFQAFYGSDTVSYKRKDTLEQAHWDYNSFHDGFSLNEDDFIRNGITVLADGPGKQATADEKVNITNLFTEHSETLRTGFEESLDKAIHLGSAGTPVGGSAFGVIGLDDVIAIDPTTGVYAGIDRATYDGSSGKMIWRNFKSTGCSVTATTGTIEKEMRKAWRACIKFGGKPDLIIAGADFIDGFINFMLQTYGRVNYGPVAVKNIEGGQGEITYMGVPIQWDPSMDSTILTDTSGITWSKRCYFINTKNLSIKDVSGHWMQSRVPPRVYNKYEMYWALTTRFYLTCDKPAAHAVLSIA